MAKIAFYWPMPFWQPKIAIEKISLAGASKYATNICLRFSQFIEPATKEDSKVFHLK